MGVSENSGTPKSSILIRFSIINHLFLGYPYFWTHPYIYIYHCVLTMTCLSLPPGSHSSEKLFFPILPGSFRPIHSGFLVEGLVTTTPPKFNMEPENDGFQKESPNFQGLLFRFHVKFQGCMTRNSHTI